ncbi:MAG: hypothetical protein RBR77_15685 [Thauera sp.]|jgi:hypothetical protein|nr:hypothetical protein [Thauera sp.]
MNNVQGRRRAAFWSAFWGAFAAPSLLFAAEPQQITRVELPNDLNARDALRNDWVRIGKDFGNVITREKSAANR